METCGHIWGPWSYACTLDGHSAERRCGICGEREFVEDDPRCAECEDCSSAHYAQPGGERARKQEFAERQRPTGGW